MHRKGASVRVDVTRLNAFEICIQRCLEHKRMAHSCLVAFEQEYEARLY